LIPCEPSLTAKESLLLIAGRYTACALRIHFAVQIGQLKCRSSKELKQRGGSVHRLY